MSIKQLAKGLDAFGAGASVDQVGPTQLLPDQPSESPLDLNALGPVAGRFAIDLAEVVQVPEPLALHVVLSALSTCCMHHANLEIDGRISPLTLALINVAKSGDRKSAADRLAHHAIEEAEAEWLREYAMSAAARKAEEVIRTSEINRIQKDKSLTATAKTEQILDLPFSERREPGLIIKDSTLEGIHKVLRRGNPYQAVIASDGGDVMNPEQPGDKVTRLFTGWSELWDGSQFKRIRATEGESFAVQSPRVTFNIQIQPYYGEKLFSDRKFLEQGIQGRFLTTWAKSRMGTRLYQSVDLKTMESAQNFYQVTRERVEHKPIFHPGGGLDLPSIQFAPAALNAWIDVHDAIEGQLGEGGELGHIQPMAAKMAENIGRIAGILAVFDGYKEISLEHTEQAIHIGQFYLSEMLRISAKQDADKSDLKAQALIDWLREKGNPVIEVAELNKSAPRPTGARKSVKEARRLMAILEEHQHVRVLSRNPKGQVCKWEVLPCST
jgi:hypothetical protein